MRRALLISTLLLLGATSANAVVAFLVNPSDPPSDPCVGLRLDTASSSGADYTSYMLPAERPASVPESARSTHSDPATESPAATPAAAPRGYLPGDTNCDGIVGAADIDVLVCRLSNPNVKPPADRWWYGWSCWGQSDLNRDGEITYCDLELLTVYLGAVPKR